MRVLAVLVALGVLIAMALAREDKGKADFAHVGDLNAEVTVLNVLHSLQLTPAQFENLRKLAGKTMQSAPPRKVIKVSENYRKTLTALRDALVEGNDDQIDKHFAKLDEIRQKEDTDFEEVEITDAARAEAPAFLRRLSARQVAVYLSGIPDFPDPVERLLDAMDQGRKLDARQWQTLRDDTAFQVGWLVGGLDTKQDEAVREKATALLNRAKRLDDKAFSKSRDALEKDARTLVGKLGPTDVIRHFMERVLVEALSSHRLEVAIEAMLKAKANAKKK